jgi:hypothetical protein
VVDKAGGVSTKRGGCLEGLASLGDGYSFVNHGYQGADSPAPERADLCLSPHYVDH